MIRMTRRLNARWVGFALALLASPALAATPSGAPASSRAAAITFIHQLASGQFTQAEARFTAQMRQHATPAKLKNLWAFMQKQFGAYTKTEGSDTLSYRGNPMVVVHTVFKRQTVGLAVFFNHAHEIAGLRVVPVH